MSQRVVKRRPEFTEKVISTLQQVSKNTFLKKRKSTTLMNDDFLFSVGRNDALFRSFLLMLISRTIIQAVLMG